MPQYFDPANRYAYRQKGIQGHFGALDKRVVLIGLLFYRIIRLCQTTMDDGMKTLFTWIVSAGIVVFLSLEFCLLSNLVFYGKMHSIERIETVYVKTTLPILWGLLPSR
jgi:hypothetical protein